MDYSTFTFHIGPIIHYAFAFFLLFLILPRWLFNIGYKDLQERIVGQFFVMVLTIIISGYLLVVLKLYEVLAILLVYLLIYIFNYWQNDKRAKSKTIISYLIRYVFDVLDGIHFINRIIIKKWVTVKVSLVKTQVKEIYSIEGVIHLALLLFVLSMSIYIRFFDLFTNAAPPLADSYVTLAWMKYIDSREVFHDGIYPQGFHIYLATLMKFSAIDALYVLRYTGPLNTILITLGFYFVVKKLTNNTIGAILSASVYGVLITSIDWFSVERQVATNSQEFAFVFIIPVIYFLLKYCVTYKKNYLNLGIIGTTIIGLVHSFAFAFVGLLIGILILTYILLKKKISWSLIKLVTLSLGTVVLSMLPIGIGMLLGKEFHSASVDYLLSPNSSETGVSTISSTDLIWIDYVTLLCVVIVFLLNLKKGMTEKDRFTNTFTGLAGIIVFIVYCYGGVLTNSTLVATRSSELWGLIVPFVIGISSSQFLQLFPKKSVFFFYSLLGVYILGLFFIYKPTPIIPYKLEHNAVIEQYLKIKNRLPAKTWLLVSHDEGYSVALGSGYHIHVDEFINQYDPTLDPLTKYGKSKPDTALPSTIFLQIEKQLFKVSKTNSIYSLLEQKYQQREKNYESLKEWVRKYEEVNGSIEIFYEDEHIIYYQLNLKSAEDKKDRMIWSY